MKYSPYQYDDWILSVSPSIDSTSLAWISSALDVKDKQFDKTVSELLSSLQLCLQALKLYELKSGKPSLLGMQAVKQANSVIQNTQIELNKTNPIPS